MFRSTSLTPPPPNHTTHINLWKHMISNLWNNCQNWTTLICIQDGSHTNQVYLAFIWGSCLSHQTLVLTKNHQSGQWYFPKHSIIKRVLSFDLLDRDSKFRDTKSDYELLCGVLVRIMHGHWIPGRALEFQTTSPFLVNLFRKCLRSGLNKNYYYCFDILIRLKIAALIGPTDWKTTNEQLHQREEIKESII